MSALEIPNWTDVAMKKRSGKKIFPAPKKTRVFLKDGISNQETDFLGKAKNKGIPCTIAPWVAFGISGKKKSMIRS